MRSMRTVEVAGVASMLLVSGCALFGGKSPTKAGTQVAPANTVYVRNSFDTDPSLYLGRFVPRGRVDLDETAAMQLACSEHISYKFIEGGGVKYTESMAVGTEVAAKLGIPVVASADVSAKRVQEVKVQYELTGKMVANIDDPSAFAECCKSQPDQCTDRYIGEFLQGTGAVYQSNSAQVSASGQGTNPTNGVSGQGGVDHEQSHDRAIEFPNPVYFAFKITETPHKRATSSCGSWVDNPPTEDGFVFFVGTSRPMRSENTARNWAQNQAMMKAAQSVSTTSDMMPDASTAPPPPEEANDGGGDLGEPGGDDLGEDDFGDPGAEGGDEGGPEVPQMDPAVERWVRSMQVVESCVEIEKDRRGRDRYVGRVLGKLPVYDG